jgi:hypothetical protein
MAIMVISLFFVSGKIFWYPMPFDEIPRILLITVIIDKSFLHGEAVELFQPPMPGIVPFVWLGLVCVPSL